MTARVLPGSRRLLLWQLLTGCLLGLTLSPVAVAQPVRFDPAQDYRWQLDTVADQTVVIEAERSNGKLLGFEWPDLRNGQGQGSGQLTSVFLEIQIDARKKGRVETRAAGTSLVQYFEPQAEGKRFLDLTPLHNLAPGNRVELDGGALRFESTRLVLTAFHHPALDQQRVLVVAPHPDDAEIAAFGLYSNSNADVVTVTSGDAGGFNYRELIEDSQHHYREKGRIRTWDSIIVPFIGGVGPEAARNLGYYDATLQRMYERPSEAVVTTLADLPDPGWYRRFNVDQELARRPFEARWANLVTDLEREILRVEPTWIASTHPLLDGHWDHQFTTIALIEALTSLEQGGALDPGNVRLLLYTNHPNEEETFPFGPRDGMPSLPPWFDQPLDFESILSLPLDEETVDLKMLALEMMHDLRPLDFHPPVRPRTHLARFFKSLGTAAGKKPPDYRYFRRAGRPAELFLVLDITQAQALREQFLGSFVRRFDSAQQEEP